MKLPQSKRGEKSSPGAALLLTVLISVSLLGAASVQWARTSNSDLLTAATPGVPSFLKSSLVPAPISKPSPTSGGIIMRQRDYGLWSYEAKQDAAGLLIQVRYHGDEVDQLKSFARFTRTRAAELALSGGVADVLVTFRLPLSPEQFREWVKAHRIQVIYASVRLRDALGVGSTLIVQPQDKDSLPQGALDNAKGDLQTIGVYSVYIRVDASQLPDVASGPLVFLADVTPTLALRELADAGVSSIEGVRVDAESPFEEMEELGLENFEP